MRISGSGEGGIVAPGLAGAAGQARLAAVSALNEHLRAVVECSACPRLRRHCERVARERRRAYAQQLYWGRPVPSTLPVGGARAVRLWIVGLAPAAHGANRTGRMFTGDRSGDFLYAGLHRAGFASAPLSTSRDDGTRLLRCAISASVRCAPPDNQPSPAEIRRCQPFLDAEWELFPRVAVVLALGGLAYRETLALFRRHDRLTDRQPPFAHGLRLGEGPALLTSFHVSQQNTFTGRLTESMLDSVLDQCRRIVQTL
jgi:uracil-DNA glycosylase family 4